MNDAHKDHQNIRKILIVIRRSHGDVLLSSTLVNALHSEYPAAYIDLLVNDDTLATARAVPNVHAIHYFSYKWRKIGLWACLSKEIQLIRSIFRKYDLAISLTANERSNIYAFLAGQTSIGNEGTQREQFSWKNVLLGHTYIFDAGQHTIHNNLKPLQLLKIPTGKIKAQIQYSAEAKTKVKQILAERNIKHFLIFHASARYQHKIYPVDLRNQLLDNLSGLGIPIIITGGPSQLDQQISSELPVNENIYDLTNQTSIDETIALTDLSLGYIGMDTLNVHIAAALNKRIFLISGPTPLAVWSPWSNDLQTCATEDKPLQTYGNITVFQANLDCVACGLAGCDDRDGESKCLTIISPKTIFREIKHWLTIRPTAGTE